ncbi:hypothetical protein AB0C27_48380 [Nonomuraea sp. NPDC048882]|uniref:hypothetical protein n=1 Tax=Nonomuraea sp. NPDC048882 TaxID=3154347 RepID=UPI003403F2A8
MNVIAGRPYQISQADLRYWLVAGEDSQLRGIQKLRRAKRWLDSSTRVAQSWTVEDEGLKEMLEFSWPHWDKPFSFDLGGRFRGTEHGGKMFVAEVKGYRAEYDLSSHFQSFLAKCYVALSSRPKRCDHFMWISWAPFQARHWDQHPTVDSVKNAVLKESKRIFDTEDPHVAELRLDAGTLTGVAQRLWLITLCDKQENLVIADNHYRDVVSLMLAEERAAL